MTEPQEPKKQLSRRDFLRLGRRERKTLEQSGNSNSSNSNSSENISENFAQAFVQQLSKLQLTRRQLLLLSAPATLTIIDQIALNGRGRRYLGMLLTNEQFRNIFFEHLRSGELFGDDLKQLQDDVLGLEMYPLELGEELSYSESWMEVFTAHEVRAVHENGEKTNKMLLIAELGKVDILEASTYADNPNVTNGNKITDFEQTVNKNHPFIVLPHSQMYRMEFFGDGDDSLDYMSLTPQLYTAYQKQNGEVVEYFEKDGGERARGGAYVLIGDELRIVSYSQFSQYEIGKNDCRAIRVCAFTIRSEHKEKDMNELLDSATLSLNDVNYPSFPSFVATFQTPEGEYKNHLISIYTHIDPSTLQITGQTWPGSRQMDISQVLGVCDQILQEKGYKNYVLGITDDDEHGAVITSDLFSPEEADSILSTHDYDFDTDMDINSVPYTRTLWKTEVTRFPIPTLCLVAKKQ